MRRILVLGLLVVALAGCDDDEDGAACTQEYRVATVTVIGEADTAVADATVKTFLERTGELVPVTSILDLVPGSYLILDDGAVPLIEGDEETFIVTVERPTGDSIGFPYVFAAPDGCHIEKVSGADTVQVPIAIIPVN